MQFKTIGAYPFFLFYTFLIGFSSSVFAEAEYLSDLDDPKEDLVRIIIVDPHHLYLQVGQEKFELKGKQELSVEKIRAFHTQKAWRMYTVLEGKIEGERVNLLKQLRESAKNGSSIQLFEISDFKQQELISRTPQTLERTENFLAGLTIMGATFLFLGSILDITVAGPLVGIERYYSLPRVWSGGFNSIGYIVSVVYLVSKMKTNKPLTYSTGFKAGLIWTIGGIGL